jgi:hypothetical protein
MDRIVFVYKCQCDNYWTSYAGQPLKCPTCGSKERDHIATVDAAVIIARALNGEDMETIILEG